MDSELHDDEDALSQIPAGKELPPVLSVMPMESFVLYPSMIAPIVVGDEKSKVLVDDALSGQRIIAVVSKRPEGTDLTEFRHLYKVAASANIVKMLKMPDGTIRLLLHGLHRIRIVEPLQEAPFLKARVELVKDVPASDTEAHALIKNIHGKLARVVELSSLPEDLRVAAMNLNDPSKLADLVASNLPLKLAEQQEILELADVKQRLRRIFIIMNREVEVMELGSKIQSQVKTEMDRTQREYMLREQMKAIRRELGDDDGQPRELDELEERLEAKPMPEVTQEAATKELARMRSMQPASAEYTVSRTYLEWILDLPWLEGTKDRLDIRKAKKVLDEDHYSLESVKERILEHLSVRKLKKDMKGPILCFAGPPGVGKTSLGRSIARAMNRKIHRISLGGMRDEAEIRGHRRTYIGAMPGRIIKALKSAGTNNPVIMLDEIDKVGTDFRGDPSSALLEVLDPEQNFTFTDNYLDLPFDLSRVLFITTANSLETIAPPLRDRMEIIQISGYTLREKLAIAEKYIVPKQLTENGITRKHLQFTKPGLEEIISKYTREAGLRNLERQVASICRKVARQVAQGRQAGVSITARSVRKYLGTPKYTSEMAQRMGSPGVSIGLAWTPAGGEILFIEASLTPGTGKLTLTGQLGDVMKESAQAALTFVRGEAERINVPDDIFSRHDIHLHVPAGAVPKDGPSAGTAISAALASLVTGRPLRNYLAMTGEITLRGSVLPVGGIKEKMLAAVRAGIREVVLPDRNRGEYEELPEEIRRKLKVHFVKHMSEALAAALADAKPERTRRPAETATAASKA